MSGRSSARRSARRRARRRRSHRPVTLLVVALLVTGAAVYVGMRSRDTGQPSASTPSATPTPSPTTAQSLDLSALPIERAAFCDHLDEGDVEDALGGPVSGTTHYESGDRVALTAGLTDVSHEFSCTFDASDGSQARVWVFAEPVTRSVGRSIVRDARAEKGCSVVDEAPTFGTPSVGTLCRIREPVSQAVTLRGLFGDAWLSCRLSTPAATTADQTVSRADQWCVRVATTLGARP